MFDYYTELNYGTSTPLSNRKNRIRVKLSKKEQITEETAERDKTLSEIGVKLTKEHFQKKYNLSEGDFDLEEKK